MFSTIVG